MDQFGTERALISSSVGAFLVDRDVVRVFGSDARSFLQGQLTQDIAGIEAGSHRFALLLSPKGRVEALVGVWGGNSDSEMLLDVEYGYGQLVVDRLNRFRMRVHVEVELLNWQMLSLYGPQALDRSQAITAQLRAMRNWSSFAGFDLIGPEVTVPEDLEFISTEVVEAIRVRDAWPSMHFEIASTEPPPLPGELGDKVWNLSVSVDKGCYTGQEVVARTHSRSASPPRSLVRVDVSGTGESGATPAVGSEIAVGNSTGVVTSVSRNLDSEGSSVLAFARRGHET